VTVSVSQGQVVSAELLDTQQHLLAAASGSVLVTLSHLASGAGESYLVHIRTGTVGQGEAEPNAAASYNLLFQLQYKYWHNGAQPENVDGNEVVAAQDVLYVIDYINAHIGTPALPAPPAGIREPYYDVNNDNLCTAQDALYVINYINGLPQGEGESGGSTGIVPALSPEAPRDAVVTRPVAAALPSLAPLTAVATPLAAVLPPAASSAVVATPQALGTDPLDRPRVVSAAGPEMRSIRGTVRDAIFNQLAATTDDLEDLLDEIAGDIDAVWKPRG
jgi:hypothetical protein